MIASDSSRRPRPASLRIQFRGPGNRITARRRAASLIELLVVVTIVLLVTSIAIRAVTPAVESRQLREGARQFNVFVNSARNRAIATGRPMGIWIDRLAGVPEAGISVSYAQVPEPYSGDYADSGAEAFVIGDANTGTSTYGPQRWVNIVRAFAASSAKYGGNSVLYDFWCTNGKFNNQRVIRPGDSIQLNYRGQLYRLMPETSVSGGPYWSISLGLNKEFFQDAGKGTTYDNLIWANPVGGWWYRINYFNDLGDKVVPYVTPGAGVSSNGLASHGRLVPYQIFRQPIRSAAGTMQFPDTVIIDLNFSGDEMKNFYPRKGGVTNLGAALNFEDPYQGQPWYPNDTTPVIVMFNPSGAVEQVYTWYYQPTTPPGGHGTWAWRGDRQLTTLSFLIGSRDRVPIDSTATGIWSGQINNNWLQPTNIWVSINPRAGLVTTGEVEPPVTPANLSHACNVRAYMTNTAAVNEVRAHSTHGNQMSGQ